MSLQPTTVKISAKMTGMPQSDPHLFAKKYRIKSTRLPQWDYSQPWWYFVTICTKDGDCRFGDVADGQMRLSEIGAIAEKYWQEIPKHFDNVSLDEFIVMPNHIHGIVIIERQQPTKRRRDGACPVSTTKQVITLGNIVGSFKSAVARWCNHDGYKNFVWQPRFYDHIIRNEKSLDKIRFYIHHNVRKWEEDRYNPANITKKW